RDYYYGLPSCPISVFRTGAPWKKPTGPEAYCTPKVIRPVFDDKFAAWTTIDVVHFAEPVIWSIVLWIGIIPNSLSREVALEATRACNGILQSFQIQDIDIAFRESQFRRYIPSTNPIAEFCGPLTASLGDNSETIYLLTARDGARIGFDHRESIQEPVEVISITTQIDRLGSRRKYWLDRSKDEEERASVESDLREEGVSMKMLKDFNNNVICDWSQEENRIIGRVLYAPPIGPSEGPKRYSEDWALIELDRSKIDWPNFKGNMIDLGTKMTFNKFVKLMLPYTYYYKYPMFPWSDRRFSIQGVIPEDELIRPIKRDTNGEPYSKLMKNCSRNETDVGCGNGIKSFVREYFSDGTEQTSLEFGILADKIRSAFSCPGDSGSIIVDSEGRAAALLFGGCGYDEDSPADITYATPFEWLLERIKAKFPNVHLYPTEDESF
ncbi:hypothetical protein BDQ17DRAFT_1366852, partial [Cyathus striatus]